MLGLSIVLAFGTLPTAVQGTSDESDAEVDRGRTKALFGDGPIPDDIEAWAERNGASVDLVEPVLDLVAFDLHEGTEGEQFLEKLRDRPNVSWAHFDGIARTQLTPNDPAWSSQYGPELIDAPAAWDIELGDSSVQLAILDTGVQSAHTDLLGNCGVDCDYDVFGHGSHVAGIAAAGIDNGQHIAGLAQVDLESYKALSDAGATWWTHVAAAIVVATQAGADVISMSLGGDCDAFNTRLCPEVQLAVNHAWNNDVVVVAASGNNGNEHEVSEPASMNNVVAVGSVGPDKTRSSFSNGGPSLDVVAPGESVISTVPTTSVMCFFEFDQMCSVSGTSMATPHVSGLASLVRSHCPSLGNGQVVDAMTDNAEDLGSSGWDNLYGHGLVDADDTLLAAC